MKVSRRGFLHFSGAALAGGSIGFNLKSVEAHAAETRVAHARETTTICPYCSVGCGIIVNTIDGKVVYTEGDPDHPINQGSLCSKGMSLYQLSHQNKERLTKPLYRAPKSKTWEEKSWDWMLDKIARNIKQSRDESLVEKNALGQTVNRTEGIASCGSAALDNEELFLYQKLLRAFGLVYIEHQARI